MPDLYRGVAIQLEAMAQASSIEELFLRLEAEGVLLRIDDAVTPTMFRGALVSESELALLRRIDDVVRMGRVQAIEPGEIVLDTGRVATDARSVHVHCAARGLARPPVRPIFEAGRVTIQPIMWGFACFQFATLGVVEAKVESDDEKNWPCAPIAYWDENRDYLSAFLAMLLGDRMRVAHPALRSWIKGSRLSSVSGVEPHLDDPRVIDARDRFKRFGLDAVQNLQKLLAERQQS